MKVFFDVHVKVKRIVLWEIPDNFSCLKVDEEWSCCAYSVESPTKDNPYYQVDTNDYELIKLI